MSLVLVSSDRFAAHLTPPGHPERVTRAHVMRAVAETWAARQVPLIAPRPATHEELRRVHTLHHIDRIQSVAGRAVRLDPDTFTSPRTHEIAVLAAGAAIAGVDAVIDRGRCGLKAGTSDSPHAPVAARAGTDDPPAALVLVRPPGHHAEAARAMGFCIYNNVALAAAHALARGVARVAIVDYDVHHGNGTQSVFYDDPRVLFVSTHQYPFYPGTGSAEEPGDAAGEGFTVNAPLEAGATDGDYTMVFDRVVLPVLSAFGPELVLVSAGFDAHMRDPLAQMRLSVDGLTALARRLRAFAQTARCPIVFVTEGGYHLKVLAACLDAIVRVLRGDEPAPFDSGEAAPALVSGGGPDAQPLTVDELPLVEHPTPHATGRGPASVELVRAVQTRYWPGL